jgi:16S rRNA (guanine527-N7)-methyltransferase
MLEPKLEQLAALVAKWNRHINLSGASSRAEILEHIEDSRAVVAPLTGVQRVLDVGSGGGFPVAVAAILLPEVQFVALEPVHKKHAFLRTVARELAPNLQALAERVEAHPVRDYDVAMSRATFELSRWLRLGLDYVRRDGGLVIGFEGARRDDLGPDVQRIEYLVADKRRALVMTHRGST